jgi:hypothetical protein
VSNELSTREHLTAGSWRLILCAAACTLLYHNRIPGAAYQKIKTTCSLVLVPVVSRSLLTQILALTDAMQGMEQGEHERALHGRQLVANTTVRDALQHLLGGCDHWTVLLLLLPGQSDSKGVLLSPSGQQCRQLGKPWTTLHVQHCFIACTHWCTIVPQQANKACSSSCALIN